MKTMSPIVLVVVGGLSFCAMGGCQTASPYRNKPAATDEAYIEGGLNEITTAARAALVEANLHNVRMVNTPLMSKLIALSDQDHQLWIEIARVGSKGCLVHVRTDFGDQAKLRQQVMSLTKAKLEEARKLDWRR